MTVRPQRHISWDPLDHITQNRIRVEKLWELEHPPTEEEAKWIRWLYDLSLWEEIPVQHGGRISRSLAKDREVLQEQKVIKPGRGRVVVPAFKVPKKGGVSRLILDCRSLNQRLPKPPKMDLKSIHAIIDSMKGKRWFAQVDGRSYFYQFALEGGVQDIIGVRIGQARGPFTEETVQVLPMGLSYAPGIAQSTSNVLLRNVQSPVSSAAWIDNFLFGGKEKSDVQEALEQFADICGKVNMELKEEGQVGCTMEALGLTFIGATEDEDTKVRPGKDMQDALKDLFEKMTTTTTIRKWYHHIGTALWVLYAVLREPLCKWEKVITEMSHMAREGLKDKQRWNMSWTMHKEAYEDLRRMTHMAIEAEYTIWERGDTATGKVIWSDASTSHGQGWVLQTAEETRARSLRVKGINIFVSELWAAAEAMLSAGDGGTVLCDNKAAIRALIRGHSSSRAGNLLLRKVCEANARLDSSIAWVPTRLQMADGPSRGLTEWDRYPGPWMKPEKVRWAGVA